MKTTPMILIAALLILGCNKSDSAKDETTSTKGEEQGVDLLEKQVDQLHEHVMQKMGSIYKWKKKLQALDSSANPEKRKEIVKSIAELDSAYDGMMDWMHRYKPEAYESDENAARQYLKGEMEKIKIVDQEIENALENAKSVGE